MYKGLKSNIQKVFREKAVEWFNESDQRKYFSNVYYQMMDAIDYMEENKIENTYVVCAFLDKISEDSVELENILNAWKDYKEE